MEEPETRTVQKRRVFSRREWLMTIAILLMLEAWILGVGYEFRAEREVIDFVSFAATIASLLLAVIAIIYGFYQSDGQQKSATEIAIQVDAMRTMQGDLNSASAGIAEQLDGLTSTATLLRDLGAAVESTREKVGSLEGGLSGIAEEQRTVRETLTKMFEKSAAVEHKAAAPSAGATSNLTHVAKQFFNKSSPAADRLAVALDQLVKTSSGSFPDWVDFIEKHYERPLREHDGENKNSAYWFVGIELLAVARGLGLLTIDLKGDKGSHRIQIHDGIYDVLASCAKLALESKTSGDAAKKIVDSFSRE